MKSVDKVYAKVVQLYAGLDLIGSKMSVHNGQSDLEVTPLGVKMHSKKTKRIVLLPFSNIKGCELMSEAEVKAEVDREAGNKAPKVKQSEVK